MLFNVPVGDFACFYSSCSLGVVFFRNQKGEPFESYLQYLVDRSLVEREMNENKEVCVKRPLRTLYLSLTYRCNLNCKYCICHNSFGQEKSDMDKGTLLKSVEVFTQLSEEGTEREIVLYGGEPTLQKDLIGVAYDYCRKLEKQSSKKLMPARFILCTNGTFIDQEFCDFLKTTDIYPAVSIDENQELHDTFRVFPCGAGSYEKSLNGYRLLQANSIKAGITMTLGSYNVTRLPELVKFVADELTPCSLAINTLLDYENQMNPYCASPKEAKIAFWEAFLAARKYGVYIVKHVMDNRVKPFVEKNPRVWGCTGTGARMAVMPTGSVVSCMAVANRAKSIEIQNIRECADFVDDFMKDYSPFVNSKCTSCIARSTCGGMCPAAIKLKNIEYDENFCNASVFFTEKLLNSLFELNESEIIRDIQNKGFFIPQLSHRRKLYGNIKVDEQTKDFQYSPNW